MKKTPLDYFVKKREDKSPISLISGSFSLRKHFMGTSKILPVKSLAKDCQYLYSKSSLYKFKELQTGELFFNRVDNSQKLNVNLPHTKSASLLPRLPPSTAPGKQRTKNSFYSYCRACTAKSVNL